MSKDKDIILMIIPALVLIAVLMLYPVVQCFIMSFTEQMLYELEGKWVGLKNYAKLLKEIRSFGNLLKSQLFGHLARLSSKLS